MHICKEIALWSCHLRSFVRPSICRQVCLNAQPNWAKYGGERLPRILEPCSLTPVPNSSRTWFPLPLLPLFQPVRSASCPHLLSFAYHLHLIGGNIRLPTSLLLGGNSHNNFLFLHLQKRTVRTNAAVCTTAHPSLEI